MSGLERVSCYRDRCLVWAVVFRQGRIGSEGGLCGVSAGTKC